jgi:hypothetical protein
MNNRKFTYFWIYFFLITFLVAPNSYSQTQVKIPWPSLADSPWPVLRGDMQGTGRSEFVGPRTNNVIWKKDMPLGVLYGPVIGYDDILYMGERALSPDSVNYFYAVKSNSEDLWTFETETYLPNNGGPIITQDTTIYFFSRNQKMYALNPDGNLKWKQNVWANFRPFYPVAKNGDIYVALVDEIVVVSPEGIIKDTLYIPDVSPQIVFSVGGDTIYFTTGGPITSGNPGAIDAANLQGNTIWSYSFAGNNWGVPLVDNLNKIYVFGTDSNTTQNRYLNCFNPDGTIDWRYQVKYFSEQSAPTIDKDGNIILNARVIINSEERNAIISLDYYGNENWVTPFEGDYQDHFINHGLVCDAEGKIYCGSSWGGNFYCIDSDGEILWTLDLGDLEYDSCPAIGSDGTLYIGTHISSLYIHHEDNLIAIRDTGTTLVNNGFADLYYSLEQNYPNPFNPTTIIKFTIPSVEATPQVVFATLRVYDVLGNEIAILVNEEKCTGNYEIEFDASNLVSGIYFYRLQAGNFVETKKMILLK